MTDSLVLVANAGDSSISTFRLSGGSLERLAVTEGLTGCSTFVLDPVRDLLYAGVKASGDGGLPAVVTLRLDRTTAALTPVSRHELPDGAMSYLALAHRGTVLLGASYGGGYGATWPVVDGLLHAPVSRVDAPNLHAVLPSADDRFAYFVSLGADLVAQFALSEDARLEPLVPATVAAPPGSGPRHLVLSAAGDAVYVLTEFSGEVLQYSRDVRTGVLALRGAADAYDPAAVSGPGRLGVDPRPEGLIWAADIHLAADGRHVWCSERTGSTLGAVTIGPAGDMSHPEGFTVTEPQPRGFDLSPDGAHLVAAGERSAEVSLYAVDGDRLQLLERAETGRGANWVRIV